MPSAAVLLREGIFDSLLHPRASAGSKGGGQFTSGGHGASGGHMKAHAPKHGKGGGAKKAKGPSKLLAYNPKTNTGPGYNMPHGDPRVHQLQEALTRLGVGDGKGKALVDDGKLGPLTTQAIQAAQTKLGLKPTGRVTPVLLNRILTAKVLAPAHKGRAKTVKVKTPRKRRVVLVHQSMTAADLLFGHSPAVAALEAWDEMLHPRGPGGKFAKLGDEERASRRKARNEARRSARAAAKTGGKAAAKTTHAVEKPHTHDSILAHASTMSDEDLGKLHEAIAAMHHDRQTKTAASVIDHEAEKANPETLVRQAYADAARMPGDWVPLAEIRDRLPAHLSRDDADEALASLAMQPGIQLVPWDNRKALTARDHKASLHFGGEQNDNLRIEDVSPPPTAPTVAKAPASVDIAHHAAQLELLRAQLSPANTSTPIEQAQAYVAGVKGAELTALAKHYGTGGRTAAEKRRNIIQARLGMLGDSMAIHPHGYAGGSR